MKSFHPIAIVGVGGIFPGASTLGEFWDMVSSGRDAAQEVPEGRWFIPSEEVYDPSTAAPDKVNSKRGCFISGFTLDPSGLELDPGFLKGLDPMFHLALHAGRQALRSADLRGTDPRRIGVVLGNIALPTDESSRLALDLLGRTFEEKLPAHGHDSLRRRSVAPVNRFVAGLPAGVLAKALALGGGTFTLDAACASSLFALELAGRELAAGRADAMLAGGLSRPDCLYTQMGFSQLRAVSPDGTCSPFDARANGLVVGEGSGMFVLKRLEDAFRDGDRIHGVIRGIGLSNDVEGNLLAPSAEGQLRAMRLAYERAGWSPQDVDLIECHATGTPLGDAVEFNSCMSLWGGAPWKEGQCVIGSVKSNVGHLLTGAGAAGLMKVLLAFKHKTLPPTANFSHPGPEIDLEKSPFRVLQGCEGWKIPRGRRSRRAAVSAFGFGGTNAHILIEEWDPVAVRHSAKALRGHPPAAAAPVAVVGMAAHFGKWSSLRMFQERVLGGGTNHPPEFPRWRGAENSSWFRKKGLDRDSFRGHYINDLEIRTDRFRIPPKELPSILPQQLLMLKTADAALSDAGWKSETRLDCGVYIGIGLDLNTTNFHLRWAMRSRAPRWAAEHGLEGKDLEQWVDRLCDAVGPALSADRTMGALGGIVASRVAREFRIGGPGFTVQSEESSGLRALEQALRALQNNELNAAIVGAVDLAGDIRSMLGAHHDRPYAGKGMGPFHPEAGGALPGEGAAAVVLKRLDDAVRDGDRVYAVIRGLGVASGGGADTFVPDGDACTTALERAYLEAGVDPSSIGYLEAHGSGIPEEDRVEADALNRFFGSDDGVTSVLGSVKSDVGHAGAASGLASFIKAALCLYQEILPGRRCHGPSSLGTRFRMPKRSQYWLRDRKSGPRKAGVNSMSVDGNCVHVVLESYEGETSERAERMQPLGARQEALFTVDGGGTRALVGGLERLRAVAGAHGGRTIEYLARQWWAQTAAGRSGERGRLAVSIVARDGGELGLLAAGARKALEADPALPLDGPRIFFRPRPIGPAGEVAFVFPGSGNQLPGVGRELSVQWPHILRRQDAENGFLRSQYLPEMFWEKRAGAGTDARSLICGQVALGTMVSDLLGSLGVRPRAVVGYSLGETVGLLALRAWPDRDEMLRRMSASTLFTSDLAGRCEAVRRTWGLDSGESVDWAVGVIEAPADEVRIRLAAEGRVYLLIENTPQECVIGGERREVEALAQRLEARMLPVEGVTTVHCGVVGAVRDAYREMHLFETEPPEGVRFYSAYRGEAYTVGREQSADSILEQALYGFDFRKVVESAYRDGVRTFLEMGPGASCTRMIGRILKSRPHLAAAACSLETGGVSGILRLLGRLAAERVPFDTEALYGGPARSSEHLEPERPEPEKAVRLPVGGEPFEVPAPGQDHPAFPEPAPVSLPRTAAEPARRPPAYRPAGTTLTPALAGSPAAALAPAAALREHSRETSPNSPPASADDLLVERFRAAEASTARAHETFLRLAENLSDTYSKALRHQMSIIESGAGGANTNVATPPPPGDKLVVFDRSQCLEFARGRIANVLGSEFAEADAFPTRVRLPDEPLMLVDRVLEVRGERRSLGSGSVVTEHDILAGTWYLDGGRIPTCIAIEAGQADLFLSAYLGIDLATRGEAVYRLLDAAVTFHRGLPGPGETIRYDIRIEGFFRQGETRLFRFGFEATVGGNPLLTMTGGCAGFFTGSELAAGKGIVDNELGKRSVPGSLPDDWEEFVPMAVEHFDESRIDALREGDLAACFGPAFEGLALKHPLRIPGGRMKLIDRIVRLEPAGGRFGLGRILAEADIQPDDWFLTCHFVDDKVMPGTLMYECCLHTLRFFLLRMGWVGEGDGVVLEPVPGVRSRLKCRGQVTPSTEKAAYEISVKELGYLEDGTPYAIADALMYADGRPIVVMEDMSLRVTGITRASVRRAWREKAQPVQPGSTDTRKPALFDTDRLLAFAVGKPSEAFGEPYRVFDEERVIARLPGPPYNFLDRITAIRAEPWKLEAGGECEAQYDIPPDAWYFDADRQERMPLAVLMEVALQACGWLSAYLGSALASDVDLSFRNLGGTATQYRPVGPLSGTLTTTVRMTSVARSGGMIIQHFEFEVHDRSGRVYSGKTYFGFFSREALAEQVGLREARPYEPAAEERARGRSFPYPVEAPFPDDRLRMVDGIDLYVPDGGSAGMGYVRGSAAVDPEAWFFKAHFHQDPVWPGSLGLESLIQLLKVPAAERWGTGTGLWNVVSGETYGWTYRGQVVPGDRTVTVSAEVKGVDEERRFIRADGFLAVNGLTVYAMKDFTLENVRGGA